MIFSLDIFFFLVANYMSKSMYKMYNSTYRMPSLVLGGFLCGHYLDKLSPKAGRHNGFTINK